MTVENSLDNVNMQTVSRGRPKCPWCGLKIEYFSEIMPGYSYFFVVIALKVRRAILKVICVATGSQNRGYMIAPPCTGNHPYERVEDWLQLSEIFCGCSMEKGVTVVEMGTDHRICHHASRLLINTSTYMM